MICDGLYESPFSRLNLSALACRNSGMPLAGVYFVKPSASALAAASLMCCGVSKSGSPAPKPTTSWPSAFICLALASIAKVSDGESEAARCEIWYFIKPQTNNGQGRGAQGGIDPRRAVGAS